MHRELQVPCAAVSPGLPGASPGSDCCAGPQRLPSEQNLLPEPLPCLFPCPGQSLQPFSRHSPCCCGRRSPRPRRRAGSPGAHRASLPVSAAIRAQVCHIGLRLRAGSAGALVSLELAVTPIPTSAAKGNLFRQHTDNTRNEVTGGNSSLASRSTG